MLFHYVSDVQQEQYWPEDGTVQYAKTDYRRTGLRAAALHILCTTVEI